MDLYVYLIKCSSQGLHDYTQGCNIYLIKCIWIILSAHAHWSTSFWCQRVWLPSSQFLSHSSCVYSFKVVMVFVQALKTLNKSLQVIVTLWFYFLSIRQSYLLPPLSASCASGVVVQSLLLCGMGMDVPGTFTCMRVRVHHTYNRYLAVVNSCAWFELNLHHVEMLIAYIANYT